MTWIYALVVLIAWFTAPTGGDKLYSLRISRVTTDNYAGSPPVSEGMSFLVSHVQGLSLLLALNYRSAFSPRNDAVPPPLPTHFPTSSEMHQRAKARSQDDSRRLSRTPCEDGSDSPDTHISFLPAAVIHDSWVKNDYLDVRKSSSPET